MYVDPHNMEVTNNRKLLGIQSSVFRTAVAEQRNPGHMMPSLYNACITKAVKVMWPFLDEKVARERVKQNGDWLI